MSYYFHAPDCIEFFGYKRDITGCFRYTYLDDMLATHAELFDIVMYWFRELVKLSDMVKDFMVKASLMGVNVFRPYSTRSQLFYVNKVLLLSLKAKDVAEAAVREVQSGKNIVIGMSDTLECILRDSIDPDTGECANGDFSTILIRLIDKTVRNPSFPFDTVFDLDFNDLPDPSGLQAKIDEIKAYSEQIHRGIEEEVFHLPMSPIDVISSSISRRKVMMAMSTRLLFQEKNAIPTIFSMIFRIIKSRLFSSMPVVPLVRVPMLSPQMRCRKMKCASARCS